MLQYREQFGTACHWSYERVRVVYKRLRVSVELRSGSQFTRKAGFSVPVESKGNGAMSIKSPFFYGWVIVALCTIMVAIQAGIMYSFGVFFKPLAADFGLSRAATSGVYSLSMIINGTCAVLTGWLADRFGPAKVAALCGFALGLGLVLTSQVSAVWQLYLTYGLIVGAGVSGSFNIGTGTTARWFVRRRGLALGIVSSGVGLGTLTVVPIAERLIIAFGWSTTYFILGIAAWVILIPIALLLRRDPEAMGCHAYGMEAPLPESDTASEEGTGQTSSEAGINLLTAVGTRPLWMLFAIYFLFSFSLQMVMVHLINYATDIGIATLVAATLLSVVGVSSIAGRLVMGTASDRIGSNNALLICCLLLGVSLLWLVFIRQLWMFYLFVIVFGFAYGGEVPQMPALISRFFGLRAVTALVGMLMFSLAIGGSLGSWLGGEIFDVTRSYQLAFAIAAIAGLLAVIATLLLKKAKAVRGG